MVSGSAGTYRSYSNKILVWSLLGWGLGWGDESEEVCGEGGRVNIGILVSLFNGNQSLLMKSGCIVYVRAVVAFIVSVLSS